MSSCSRYDADKMVPTYAPIRHGPIAIASADDPKIQKIETHYDDLLEVFSIQKESRDCDSKEKL